MKNIYGALLAASMLILSACDGDEEVKVDSTPGNEQSVTDEKVENESMEQDNDDQDESKTDNNVENIADIAEYFKLNGHRVELSEDLVGHYEHWGALANHDIIIDDIKMDLYQFDSSDPISKKRLDGVKRTGDFFLNPGIVNGGFLLVFYNEHPYSEEIKEIFESFNTETE